MELTDNVAEEADVILVNTCSIREKAQESVPASSGRWRQTGPDRSSSASAAAWPPGRAARSSTARHSSTWYSAQTLHRLPG